MTNEEHIADRYARGKITRNEACYRLLRGCGMPVHRVRQELGLNDYDHHQIERFAQAWAFATENGRRRHDRLITQRGLGSFRG